MKSVVFALAALFSAQSALACLQFPCGMYKPNHPANQRAADKPVGKPKTFKPKQVRCTLERIEKKRGLQSKTTATMKARAGENKYSRGLDLGKYNFSFGIEYREDSATEHGVNVAMQENKVSQDDVGYLNCPLNLTRKAVGNFCEDVVYDFNKKPAFLFYCQAVY